MNSSGISGTRPKISVIIPLYNHERYIREAVCSVLEQTVQDFELIIINDGSTDNSESVVKNIHDRRIRYYHQENRGAHDALNTGISLANGDYVSILNSDDLYSRERFEENLTLVEGDPALDAVFSHIEIIDEEGNPVRVKSGAEDNWLGRNPETSFKESDNIILDLLAGNFLHTSSNLFCRRSVFSRIGNFIRLRYTHDYEFFLRLCYSCNVRVIAKPLLRYRLHGANTLREDFALSIFETGLVLANFFMNYDLKKVFPDIKDNYEMMARFMNSLNTYDSDRMIIVMLLLGERGTNTEQLFGELTSPGNLFREACLGMFKKHHDISTIKQTLAWQEGQTELWWRTAEECKDQLAWQKEQSEGWWKEAQDLKNALSSTEEELRRATEALKRTTGELSMKKVQLELIHTSCGWRLISGLRKISDRILPNGSKRRIWVKDILKKLQ